MNEESESQVTKRIDGAAEKYSQFKVARSLIQLIPFGVGSAIDSFFGNRANDIQANRFICLVQDLKSAVEQLDEDKLDKKYVNSDDFYFLCRNVFSRVVNEREKEKLKLFRNIIVGAITINRPDEVFVEVCTSLLSELTSVDIQVLRKVKDYNYIEAGKAHYEFKINEADQGAISYEGNRPEDLGLPEAALLVASGQKLRRLGLVNRISMVSPLGNGFIEFVLNDAHE